MNAKERELVTEEFCAREDTYNLCPGGHGGFGYINKAILTTKRRKINGSIRKTPRAPPRRRYIPTGKPTGASGPRNFQYGRRWIYCGTQSRRLERDEILPSGWKFGQKPKPIRIPVDRSAKGRKLAKERYEKFLTSGLSMRKFAKEIGVSQPNLSQQWKKYGLFVPID